MRGIEPRDRVLLVGSTGDGKTTLARYIVQGLQPIRTIVLDPKAQLRFPGVAPVSDPDALPAALRAPLCHYIPTSFKRDELEEAAQHIWLTPGPWLLHIDEASEVSSPNWCPEGLRFAATQGREPRKMLLVCTQRLTECHPVFRSQAEHIFLLVPRPIDQDLKIVAGHVRREHSLLGAELDSLHAQYGPYSHLWYVKPTNELRRCAPLPATAVLERPRPAATAPAAEHSPSRA